MANEGILPVANGLAPHPSGNEALRAAIEIVSGRIATGVADTTALAAIGASERQEKMLALVGTSSVAAYYFDADAESGDVAPAAGSGYWKKLDVDATALAALAATGGAALVGTSRSSTVEAELTSLVTAEKEIPLGSLRLSSGAAIAAFADNTTDGFAFVDSECVGIRWNDSGSSRITVVGQVDIPADASDSAAIVLHAKGFRVGGNDIAMVLTVTAFAQPTGAAYDADENAGGSSTAFDGNTKIVTDETLSFAAGVLPAGAGVSFSLVPDSALDQDDFVLTSLRLTYTRSLA